MSESANECTNIGCGKRFRQSDNDGLTDPCVFHPSAPVFHDAYKVWPCCQLKSTDFSTFLAFKGCKSGKHSTEKRITTQQKSVSNGNQTQQQQPAEEEPEVVFRETDWRQLTLRETKGVAESAQSERKAVAVRCRQCGQQDVSRAAECRFHCGQTIFHDSLKYWSCCPQKKFTEFSEFQALPGCQSTPTHQMEAPVEQPREDWFQSPDSLTIVLYGLKGVRAHSTHVQSNGRTVRALFGDGQGVTVLARDWTLRQLILAADSEVLVERTRVELRLRKGARGRQWDRLTED